MKILFVENHAVFAKTVTDLFLNGHDVVVVASLAAARHQLAEDFDVVLVDYDLDDGKGDELVSELRTADRRPRIVGVSARPDGNSALLAAGADAVCSKGEFSRIRPVIEGS